MTVAVYAGTFDPITNGHVDIAVRASRIFDQVIIGVYDSPASKRSASSGDAVAGRGLLFSTKERVELAKGSINNIPNIKVVAFTGLIVDFARKMDAQVIVRGLRAATDFEREFETAMMNKELRPDLEIVCFMASLQYQFLSSSLLKEIAGLGGDIDSLVPKQVVLALRKKLIRKDS